MACGTGKTLVALWTAEQLRSRRTLVLLPSLSLLAQTLREWTANASSPFNYLAVCSDETVAERDAFVTSTSELGFPVTTVAAAIASFLAASEKQVVFSTYQSSPRIASAQDDGAPSFDLVVADEAHRCAGQVSSDFATVLDTGRIRGRRRLFMTATPRYFTGRLRREAAQLDVEIASMDDEDHFGPVLHRLGFAEAISRDLLSDYQVLVVGVSGAEYRELAERGAFITADGTATTDARTLASQLTLLKAMRTYDLRRVISFHSRVRRARDFSSSLQEVVALLPSAQRPSGNLHCDFVSGEMPSGQRDSRLARFRDLDEHERALLANARCLGEGVDIPAIDGVAFIDPRRSQIDIVQAVGRAIRRSDKKKIGTIVLPIFVEDEADPERALEDSSFNNVWEVLKALRAHDDELGEQLDEFRRELGRHARSQGHPEKIKLELPIRIGEDFVRAFEARLIEETTASWEFWFGLLERYVEREGHARVPAGYPTAHLEDGQRLGQWVAVQRKLYKQGTLDLRRQRLLKRLPDWTWAPFDTRWEEGYAKLQVFVAREQHARVPTSHIEDGFPLGRWVADQRERRGKRKLSDERLAQLETLPGWVWNRIEASWEDGFARLCAYAARESHARPPTNYRDDGFLLGSWCSDQRKRYKQAKLDPDKAQRLAALPGWVWQIGRLSAPRRPWEHGYQLLVKFAGREGHARVPAPHVEEGFRLGQWVGDQRKAHKQDRLSSERTSLVESLPGWRWSGAITTSAWEEGFEQLRQFVAREGHALVPQQHIESGYKLGNWVGVQRAKFAEGSLVEERARLLETTPGWTWDANKASWDLSFAALQSFAARKGHARVPIKHVEGSHKLGQWVGVQRQVARQGKLAPERRAKLASVPGWAWDVPAATWDEGFARLAQYVDRFGNANAPRDYQCDDGFRLGQWVANRRAEWKRNDSSLTAERRDHLQALSGWVWDTKQDSWDRAFAVLEEYVRRQGTARVPVLYRENGFALGQWVSLQRGTYRSGTLSPERRQRLEALPGWTWSVLQRKRARR
jgi:superfamily II DNA or RNA helicase